MKFNERNIFLLDGVGALLSAVSSGLVLPIFSQWLGLQLWILYGMALLGISYAAFSFFCFFLAKRFRPLNLMVLIAANSIYGVLLAALLIIIDQLTIWGRAVLIADILIIATLVFIETNVYRESLKRAH